MKRSILYLLALLSAVTAEAQKENWKVTDKGPSIDNYFTPASAEAATPDDEGFIRRWLLLEPIDKPNRSNTVFTDSYLQQHLGKAYLKDQFTSMPKNGQKVKVGKQKLKWHALNSQLFNVKLFRFATGLDKQYYGIVFLATTTSVTRTSVMFVCQWVPTPLPCGGSTASRRLCSLATDVWWPTTPCRNDLH